MELLAVIGIIALIAIIFTCGGLLGWCFELLKGVFSFLSQGCGSCIGAIIWLFIIISLLLLIF
jgi:hypothetical protein